jgi:hypothetical protein
MRKAYFRVMGGLTTSGLGDALASTWAQHECPGIDDPENRPPSSQPFSTSAALS